MTHSAHETIRNSMHNVSPDINHPRWDFLNRALCAIVPEAELDPTRNDVLVATIQEVVCGSHDRFIKSKRERRKWAMEVATWVNGAYVALKINQSK